MPKSGPIIFVEDDIDDQEMLETAIKETGIKNKIVVLNNGDEAFQYLKETPERPFLILSDLNMPRVDGIELKEQIDRDYEIKIKSIPYILFSTSVQEELVNEAFSRANIQGYFQKCDQYKDLVSTLKLILEYWKSCERPRCN